MRKMVFPKASIKIMAELTVGQVAAVPVQIQRTRHDSTGHDENENPGPVEESENMVAIMKNTNVGTVSMLQPIPEEELAGMKSRHGLKTVEDIWAFAERTGDLY